RRSGFHEFSELGLIDLSEKRHALEVLENEDEMASGLRHALDQEHARQDRIAWKVTLEDRRADRHLSTGAYGSRDPVDGVDPVNQVKIFESHPARIRPA